MRRPVIGMRQKEAKERKQKQRKQKTVKETSVYNEKAAVSAACWPSLCFPQQLSFLKLVSPNPQGVYPAITLFSCISWTGPLVATGATAQRL